MSGTPRVSVIIPVYNVEAYLRECLDSVTGQTLEDVEILCVDDGSTDGSLAILQEYAARDSRVQVLTQANAGPGAARNRGMEAARGEYLLFQDSDDYLADSGVLEAAWQSAAGVNGDLLLGKLQRVNLSGVPVESPSGYTLPASIGPGQVFTAQDLGYHSQLFFSTGPWAKLYRRSFLLDRGLRFPCLKHSEDFPLVQAAVALAERIVVLERIMSCYRMREDSTSLESRKDEAPLLFREGEQLLFQRLSQENLSREMVCSLRFRALLRLLYNLRTLNTAQGFHAVFQASPGILEEIGLDEETIQTCFPDYAWVLPHFRCLKNGSESDYLFLLSHTSLENMRSSSYRLYQANQKLQTANTLQAELREQTRRLSESVSQCRDKNRELNDNLRNAWEKNREKAQRIEDFKSRLTAAQEDTRAAKERVRDLKARLEQQKRQTDEMRVMAATAAARLRKVKASRAYRLSRLLTWPMRKLKKLLKRGK